MLDESLIGRRGVVATTTFFSVVIFVLSILIIAINDIVIIGIAKGSLILANIVLQPPNL
jgi:hypothetical protein